MPKKGIFKTEVSTLWEDFKNMQEIKIPHFPYNPTVLELNFLHIFQLDKKKGVDNGKYFVWYSSTI